MEHSYDDTVSNLLIVSQDDAQLQSLYSQHAATASSSGGVVGAGDSAISASSSTSLPSPSFNTVPLLPNSYMDAVRRQAATTTSTTTFQQHPPTTAASGSRNYNSPRDTSSYLRSRLERSNAIRRGVPGCDDQTNLIQQLGELRTRGGGGGEGGGGSESSPLGAGNRDGQGVGGSNHSPRSAVSSSLSSSSSSRPSSGSHHHQNRGPPDLLPTDSNQHSSAESRRLVHWFDNLMAELSQNNSSSSTSSDGGDNSNVSSNNVSSGLGSLDHHRGGGIGGGNSSSSSNPRSLLEHAVLEACLGEANRRQRALADSVLDDAPAQVRTLSSLSSASAGSLSPARRSGGAQPQNNSSSADNRLSPSTHSRHAETRDSSSTSGSEALSRLERELLSDFSNLLQYPAVSGSDDNDEDSSNHEEHSDNENFYDDNFEDYDEHYIAGEGDGEEEGNNTTTSTEDAAFPEEEDAAELQGLGLLGVGEEIEMDNRFLATGDSVVGGQGGVSSNAVIDNRWSSHRMHDEDVGDDEYDDDGDRFNVGQDSEDEHYSQMAADWQSDNADN